MILLLIILLIIYTGCIVKYYNEELDKLNDKIKILNNRLCAANKKYEEEVTKNRNNNTPRYEFSYDNTQSIYPFSIDEQEQPINNVTNL